MLSYLYIALGGAFGAVSRVFVQKLFSLWFFDFPAGTLFVNIVGSFLLGMMYTLSVKWHVGLRVFFLSGFLGAFTTMSTYAFEVVTMYAEKKVIALAYFAITATFCVLLCAFGAWFASQLD